VTDIESLVQEVNQARKYTNLVLDTVDENDWFRQSTNSVTHIAWQVGHLAVGQYRLGLLVIRGQQASDGQLIPEAFINRFQPGSNPSSVTQQNSTVAEVREVFDRVHAQTVSAVQQLSSDSLNEPTEPEHPMFSTKGGAIRWSTHHEYTHAGQISLLRRLLGYPPLW